MVILVYRWNGFMIWNLMWLFRVMIGLKDVKFNMKCENLVWVFGWSFSKNIFKVKGFL